MALFVCSTCGCVDNTALAPNYHTRNLDGRDPETGARIAPVAPPLCSACDPESGQWHGRFERLHYLEWERRHPESLKQPGGALRDRPTEVS